MTTAVRVLFVATLAAGLLKLALTPWMDPLALAAAFALAYFVCAAWLRGRATAAPVALAALLFAVELSGLPVYARDSWNDWLVQGVGAVVWTIGLAAAVATGLERRRSRRPAPARS